MQKEKGNISGHKYFQMLYQYLAAQYSLSDQDKHLIFDNFQFVEAKKGTLLHRQGDICRYAVFVCCGCVKTFFINSKGDEYTRYISFENGFVSAFSSFISETPSIENVQVLEDSKLLRINRNNFFRLTNSNTTFAKLYLHSLEQAQIFSTWRIETMISMTARERYEDILTKMPELVLLLSNKQVASFLGITQESLSRLKSNK